MRGDRVEDERLLAALHLRDKGVPYDEIAVRLGYESITALRGMISKVRKADREHHRGDRAEDERSEPRPVPRRAAPGSSASVGLVSLRR